MTAPQEPQKMTMEQARLQASVDALAQQRNNAMDQMASLQGELTVASQYIKGLEEAHAKAVGLAKEVSDTALKIAAIAVGKGNKGELAALVKKLKGGDKPAEEPAA